MSPLIYEISPLIMERKVKEMPINMVAVSPTCRYETLNQMEELGNLIVQVDINDNPMYFDEEGNRNIKEPLYQTVIRVISPKTKTLKCIIYDYFDCPTYNEAVSCMSQICNEIRSIGFRKVFLSS